MVALLWHWNHHHDRGSVCRLGSLGPWEDESFTLGVFGLIGLFSLMSAGLDGNLEQMG